jgi:protein arginine kinase
VSFELNDLLKTPSRWLGADGPHPDVVLSSRLRLARNLSTGPFPPRARKEQLAGVIQSTLAAARHLVPLKSAEFLNLHDMPQVGRTFLVERHLISRDLAQGTRVRGVLVAPGEELSVMINEEDHLRVQSIASGFQPTEAWDRVNALDDLLEKELEYAFRNDYGYLTACPTNAGTGMRASVLIHLPSLVLTKQAKKVLQGVSAVGLAVRGFYGEGTEVMGNFFQISNQTTLGRSERDILENLERVTRQLIEYENKAREAMIRSARVQVEDKVWRAYGTFRYSRSISSQETISLASAVRFGIAMGLDGLCDIKALNEIMVYSQPAHVQQMAGREMDSPERNVFRADYIRERLNRSAAMN